MDIYEKKYKEALEKVKIWQNHLYEVDDKDYADELNYIFPELKESEDEKIRKELITHCSNTRCVTEEGAERIAKWIAWLEKQGNEYPTFKWHDINEEPEEMKELFCEWESDDATWHDVAFYDAETKTFRHAKKPINVTKWVYVSEILSEDEILLKYPIFDYSHANIRQKDYAPKQEPKFKVGDWVARGNVKAQIIGIEDNKYCFNGYKVRCSTIDKQYHLWTIEDANDGDVLASKDKEDILIYKSYSVIDLLLTSHISFSKKEGFCPRQYSAWDSNEFIPATKEQRNLLFQKMHEAKYMWDSDSKQLLSLKAEPSGEQRPAWSEEDEKFFKTALWHISYSISNGKSTDIHCDTTEWLKSLKDRIIPQPKQEWSEEDEKRMKKVVHILSLDGRINNAELLSMYDWLISLRLQNTWKPSDEQMKALHDLNLTGNISYAGQGQTLIELYNDLKKLTE